MRHAPAVGLLLAANLAVFGQTAGDRLRADLAFLTSEPLAGRLSLTPQADIAALYLAAEFQKAGLRPANGDSYLQPFALVAYRGDPAARKLSMVRNGRLKTFPRAEFTGAFYREAHIEAPLVFAGYGITAAEYRYDDYAGLDASGRVVLIFDHEPQEDDPRSVFAGTGQTLHWGRTTKMRNAQRHGAVAVLIASEPLRKHSGLVSASGTPQSGTGQPLRASAPTQSLDDPTQIPVFSVSDQTAAELLTAAGRTPAELQRAIDAKLEPQSLRLADTTVRLDTANTEERRGTSLNAVGVLEGSDPALRSETVLLTAHYDHLGVQNGRLYPGANDNTSGTVAVLELARRFAQAPRPKRSIVFAVFGSEEELMLGSYYYVQHPLRPLDKSRAVINLDMIGRDEAHIPQSQGAVEIPPDTSNYVNLIGGYYSPDLIDTIRRANRKAGLTLDTKFDRDHVLNTLFRCDHLPFLMAGVPAVWIFGGFHPGYHEPSDTMEKLNYAKIEKSIELAFGAAVDVAGAATPPRFFRGR